MHNLNAKTKGGKSMKFKNLPKRINKLTALLLAFFLISVCSINAQEQINNQEGEIDHVKNWLYESGDREMRINYKFYSKDDLTEAQNRLEKINAELEKDQSEWFGRYSPVTDAEVSHEELILSRQNGFLQFYVYTCMPELRYLNFGEIVDEPGAVWLKSASSLNSRRKLLNPAKYVKVIWGKRHFLILENDLQMFLIKAAGLEIVDEENRDEDKPITWLTVYEKHGESEKSIKGLPIVPFEYAHLLRHPIEAKIIAVGKRTVEVIKDEFSDEPRNLSNVIIKLNVGSQNGVEKGMNFRILKTGELIEITKVNRQTSVGIVAREIDENGRESYYDHETKSDKIYSKIIVGWKLTTAPEPESLSWGY
jgi:hypothetical protein